MPWTPADLPDLTGRTFLITGANSGIGKEAARELARKGGRILMACRSLDKANEAMADLRADVPGADLTFVQLDLARLTSVRVAADAIGALGGCDVLINNAGIMAIPRTLTADGFEMQIGTNHLGHFALTGLLLPDLLRRPGARVVTVSSVAHRIGRMDLTDLMGERRYQKWAQYGRSKLANLLFHHELHRRLQARAASVISVACHPGYAATNLQHVGPQMESSALGSLFADIGNRWIAQSAAAGAWPTEYAATAAAAGEFIGPDGFNNWRGHPTRNVPNAASRDAETMRLLWERSVELTGVDFGGL
ncbi:MAG TPA: oxidoreductase [Myxococcota bacterium]|nr:oxidoreductase [Myxococcota bacterium]